ncbi:MAG: chromate efflux transporter [Rhodobacteraceae bacterium]|nr:chromate efflux transporter [Paracoccaceae bacterium]
MARVFGRIGILSFGGPAAQIALMHRELVEERPWLEDQTFLRALSLCMMLPGPEAMQLATYCGWRLRGVTGGLIAGGLFVLPGALVIAALVWLYAAYGDLPLVSAAFLGIKAAVIAIVLQALIRLSGRAFPKSDGPWLAGMAFLAIFALNLPFPVIIAAAAFWGWVQADTVTDTAPVARPSGLGVLRIVTLWGGLWLLPLAVLSVTGPVLLADLGWFFAKLAVVTFGGAYAVLAYMTQTVVSDYGWLTTGQMIDALGLAETTPGPLILVTQFVAMLTTQLQGGVGLALAAGLVALWATFVPCFLWIFLAGPYVDWIAVQPRLAGALQAVTAAVVGVIANLSLWFALHVIFADLTQLGFGPVQMPWPVWSSLDPSAVILTGLAAVLLLPLKRGPAEVLALMAAAALGLSFVMA